ncbi:MAG TPA: hypothetical protein VFD32_01290 [Dehalococcoidia bacterium]|nr:hypothetical protein [Dehalococcoidia bacterium]
MASPIAAAIAPIAASTGAMITAATPIVTGSSIIVCPLCVMMRRTLPAWSR